MAITKDDLKGMQGKRITIDGERHRVEKIVVKTGEAITEDGTRVHIDGIYKRGPGFFFDTPKKGKKAAKEEPTKPTRARTKKAKADAEDDAPANETARQRRRRLKREAAEAEGAPVSKRARSKQKDEPEAPKGKPKAAKKKLVEAFDQRIAEAISNDAFALLGNALSTSGVYDVVPVAVGAQFNENALKLTITLLPGSKSDKEIKAYIREHREATDVAPDDDEDDDSLDDEGLDDDDEDDEGLEDELLGDLDVADLKKIARKLGITTKKSMDADAVIALIREDDDNDDDAIREAADEAGVELGSADESEEDDEDEVDDNDGELEDDEDDESEDEDDEEEEDDESEEAVSVEDMVNAVRERAPNLSEGKVRGFIEAYLASDEIEDKFGDDMVPGQTVLKGKEDKHEFLLVGYDEADETVKLLNLDSLKFRSKSIADVARMEEVEAE